MNKINILENKILTVLNNNLEVNTTSKEIKINLNGKIVGNLDLELWNSFPFINLKELDLGNNKTSNIVE